MAKSDILAAIKDLQTSLDIQFQATTKLFQQFTTCVDTHFIQLSSSFPSQPPPPPPTLSFHSPPLFFSPPVPSAAAAIPSSHPYSIQPQTPTPPSTPALRRVPPFPQPLAAPILLHKSTDIPPPKQPHPPMLHPSPPPVLPPSLSPPKPPPTTAQTPAPTPLPLPLPQPTPLAFRRAPPSPQPPLQPSPITSVPEASIPPTPLPPAPIYSRPATLSSPSAVPLKPRATSPLLPTPHLPLQLLRPAGIEEIHDQGIGTRFVLLVGFEGEIVLGIEWPHQLSPVSQCCAEESMDFYCYGSEVQLCGEPPPKTSLLRFSFV